MTERLYSIVMPTRDRPDTLRHAIATVLRLERPNYELIVMDNCGGPETRQVVESFAAPQLRYFRAEERLSMADNWERGLDEVRGDYVTFIGDDDGFLPDALHLAERFHAGRPSDILSWWPFLWLWPDAEGTGAASQAHMHFASHIGRHDSRAYLKRLFACQADWTSLPTLYCSFVPRGLIDEMRSRHGRYFLAPLPDVFSGIANLLSSDAYFYSYRPLTCWGISRHSSGAAQYFEGCGDGGRFDAENARSSLHAPWDERLRGAEFIVELRVADLYLKMKDRLFPEDDELILDIPAYLRHVATAAAPRFRARWTEVKRAVEEMAEANGLDPADFPVAPPVEARPDGFSYHIMPDIPHFVRFHHVTDPASTRTIEDFVDYARRMCVPADKVQMPPAELGDCGAPAGKMPLLTRIAGRIRRNFGRIPR